MELCGARPVCVLKMRTRHRHDIWVRRLKEHTFGVGEPQIALLITALESRDLELCGAAQRCVQLASVAAPSLGSIRCITQHAHSLVRYCEALSWVGRTRRALW